MVQNVAGKTAWCLHAVPAFVVAVHIGRVSTFSAVAGAVCACTAAQKRMNRKTSEFFIVVSAVFKSGELLVIK